MKHKFSKAFAVFALCAWSAAHAESKNGGTLACPPIVADTQSGEFQKTTSAGKNRRYECFKSSTQAKKKGYLSLNSLNSKDFTGWWRLRLKSVNDSCAVTPNGVGPALFIQIIQTGSAVFADFCPSLGRETGVRNDNGISTQRTEIVKEYENPLGCADGLVEVSENLELARVVDGSMLYSARFVTVRRCPGTDEGARSCASDFIGEAFPETHKIWPVVDPNASTMKNGCSVALTRCVECHENLKDLPQINP